MGKDATKRGAETARLAPLGPIATRIVYEDERVRVWDQLLEPGESTGPHEHTLPYALVTVEGSRLDVLSVPGHPAQGTQAIDSEMLRSEALRSVGPASDDRISVEIESQTAGILPAGSVEEAVNTGERTFRAILVEFKQRDPG